MNRYQVTAIIALLGMRVFAATTNIIDIAALAACGTGTTNGWTVCGIDSYSDKTSIRINHPSEYILSPDFPCAISEIIIHVKSSSKTGPVLAFTPRVSGIYNSQYESLCAYSPNKDSYVQQHISIRDCPPVTAFKISYAKGGDGNTGWGISYMAVVTDDTPVLLPPKNTKISKIRSNSATISWENCNVAISNLVLIYLLSTISESYNIVADYNFDLCYGHGSSANSDQSTEFHELYPEFTGERIYYPNASTGIVQISTTKANGHITHCGFSNYSNLTMKISVSRPDNDKNSLLYAYYIDNGQQTNVIGTAFVTNTFTNSTIPLSGTPGGVAIHLGNLDGFKSDRRYLINRISFLSNYKAPCIETNLVSSTLVKEKSMLATNLAYQSNYLVSVIAFDALEQQSEPSVPLRFTTRARDSGFMLVIK